MAGGQGTRLRPLTCTTPKPLALLCGKPVAEYILELLSGNGFKEAVFTLGYLGDRIRGHFDEGKFAGIDISFSEEESPLGTAGGVKKAAGDEDVLVISGDAFCDFDLKSAVGFHREKNADVTIIGKHVPDPREYGLILSDGEGKIRGFQEKPSFEGCATDLANTGVYIISKKAMGKIPQGKVFDFAGDLFPELLKDGSSLYVYEEQGYWCDIGDLESYIKCQQDILEGKARCSLSGVKSLDGKVILSESYRGVRIVPPVYIGEGVVIEPGAIIDKGSVICDNVTVCEGAKIHGSVLLPGAYAGRRSVCNRAILCEGARVLSGGAVYEGGVLGAGAVAGENSVVESGVRLWPMRQLEKGAAVSYDLKFGNKKRVCLDDEGICGETGGEITPAFAALYGEALGALGKVIPVGYNKTPGGKALAMAVMSGILSSGGTVWDIGECLEEELSDAVSRGNHKAGCYVEAGVTAKLKAVGEGGMSLTRKQERILENGLNRGEFRRVGCNCWGELMDMSSLTGLYREELFAAFPTRLFGICAEVNTADKALKERMNRFLRGINDPMGERVVFHISSDGKKLSVYTERTGYIFYEKLLLMACRATLRKGEAAALPLSAPSAADVMAKSLGGKILRYCQCPSDESDRKARLLAAKQKFTRDALWLMAVISGDLSYREKSFYEALEELPQFTAAARFVAVDCSPAVLLQRLCCETAGFCEGVVASENQARVLIRPVKTGKGVMMFAESFKSETAAELCDIYEKKISEISYKD